MTQRFRVPIYGKPTGFVAVENGATAGSVVGLDLYWPDGALVTVDDLRAPAATPSTDYPITYWRLIQEIPPNVTALADTSTTGIYVVTGPGTSATRGLLPGPGINITFSNGVAGDPTIAHADTSSVANISASFTGSTVPGEISFTFDQFGHVLTRTITGRQLDHNDLGALQGGAPGEYYHLTNAEHSETQGLIAAAPQLNELLNMLALQAEDGSYLEAEDGTPLFTETY